MSQETADVINNALHALLELEPCETACTHWLDGSSWTLLGIANVVGRHSDDV